MERGGVDRNLPSEGWPLDRFWTSPQIPRSAQQDKRTPLAMTTLVLSGQLLSILGVHEDDLSHHRILMVEALSASPSHELGDASPTSYSAL